MSSSAFAGVEIRLGSTRGHFGNAWLDARFSFSFGAYRNPARQRFGAVLALNEDVVQPARGFAMHHHENLDILMIPWTGAIEHRDSLGGYAIVKPGEVQVMHAASGILHSQMNASATHGERHFQLWFAPPWRRRDAEVLQRSLGAQQPGHWTSVVAPAAGTAAIDFGHDLAVDLGQLDANMPLLIQADLARSLYLHLMDGEAVVHSEGNVLRLQAGDALACAGGFPSLTLCADRPAAVLRIEQPAL
ncbi:pirin family protein [uncultured Azohydromonas sp.]|jgi:Pirin-related protein|uniref:pirin family protein n=1 Tax=uncultured Azohydromonas sp. TaxID=487342 RepID=UPI00260A6485|nr:pirin family protein [uncultured Azohydromonas sp.]